MSSETPSLDAAMDEIRLAGTMLGGISTDLQWAPERARLHATIRAAESRIRTTVRALQAERDGLKRENAELRGQVDSLAAIANEGIYLAGIRVEVDDTMPPDEAHLVSRDGTILRVVNLRTAPVRSQEDSANG